MKANPFKKTPNMDSKEREIVQEELRDEQPEQEQQLFEEEKTSNPSFPDGNLEDNEKTATGDSETLLTEEEKLIQQLEEANALIEEQKDKYLRLSAEFDNYRKRTVKDKAVLIFNGGEKTINSILPTIDDMERALKTMETSDVAPAIQEGIELIYNKFISALGQNGVKIIETKDKPLDTDFHEAIAVIPAPSEEQKGKILDCVQTGYTLNDKVIRHAKVVVGE
jgi:molecular chaperone GrpE